MKLTDIEETLTKITLSPSKWELDLIIYFDRLSNKKTMISFLSRINELNSTQNKSKDQEEELEYLLELLDEVDEYDIENLTNVDNEKKFFIENLARKSAIEVLTNGKISFESMNSACKLNPSDFILCAKRTQDLMNSIKNLVIKGETLSKDVPGA